MARGQPDGVPALTPASGPAPPGSGVRRQGSAPTSGVKRQQGCPVGVRAVTDDRVGLEAEPVPAHELGRGGNLAFGVVLVGLEEVLAVPHADAAVADDGQVPAPLLGALDPDDGGLCGGEVRHDDERTCDR
jgi:hypothetical protein